MIPNTKIAEMFEICLNNQFQVFRNRIKKVLKKVKLKEIDHLYLLLSWFYIYVKVND